MRLLRELGQDAQLSVRRLRRDIGFSSVTVACLTLAIGGVTSVYSVIQPVLWRPLPFPDSEYVQVLQAGFTAAGGGRQLYAYSGENYIAVRDEQSIFDAMGAILPDQFLIGHGEDAAVVPGVLAAAGVFDVLQLHPTAGRLYTAVEESQGESVALISEGLWHRHFGGDPKIVGRPVMINDIETLLVGVLPAASAYPQGTDVWLPMRIDQWPPSQLELGTLTVLVRLRRDAAAAEITRALSDLDAMLVQRNPGRNTDRVMVITTLRDFLVGDISAVMTGLLGAVTFLALIGAINVGALLFARGRALTRELALRAVLGASRGRIMRHLFTETFVLCAVGGLGGLVLAWITVPALLALAPEDLPSFVPIVLGRNGVAFGALMSIAFTVVIGTAPAFLVSRDAVAQLRSREVTGSRSARKAHDALVATELAIAMVLLAVAGLFLLDLSRLTAVPTGVIPENVMTFRVRLPDTGYESHERIVVTFDEMLERVRALPGVTDAGAVHRLPLGDGLMGWSFSVEDLPPTRAGQVEVALSRVVAGDYLNTVGVPVIHGRGFDQQESASSQQVVIVSQALADRYWPGADPLGRRIKRRSYDSDRPWLTIIGVAANVRDRGPASPHQPVIYRPLSQTDESYANQLTFVVRNSAAEVAPPSQTALRRSVNQVEPLARVYDFEPYDTAVTSVTGPVTFAATLLSVFAGLGLLLTAAGVFGITLYVVQRRLPEIGIRRALGATEWVIFRETVKHAVLISLIGVALGLVALAMLRNVLATRVATVTWFEPWAVCPVVGLLLLTAGVAAAIPARRGANADPVSLLKR